MKKIKNLKIGESLEIRPFMITYEIYKVDINTFEVTTTDHAINQATCNLKELKNAIKTGFSNLKFT